MVLLCQYKKCETRACFGYKNKEAKRCVKHKLKNMIDVKNKMCEHINCNKRAHFGFKNNKPRFCKIHKLNNMIDVGHKICENNDCYKRAYYGYVNNRKIKFCFNHKIETMIFITSDRCKHKNCQTVPCYGFEGEKAQYCSDHKLTGMIDVKNKTCNFKTCKILPTYGYEKNKPLRCYTHKINDMIDVKGKKCEHNDCEIRPCFGYENEKARFCDGHKLDNMINVKDKLCISPLCPIHASNKNYEGYCLRCFIYTHPDKPVARNYKTKERAVAESIFNQFPINNYKWINDKKIHNGMSLYRPDLMLDLGYQIIMIEVDEDKHKSYDCLCENKRLVSLSQDVNHRPIIFIRFNPDSYINSNGKKIVSCWKVLQTGICTISSQKEWNCRLENLKNQINYWIDPLNKTDKMIEIIQLYYDGFR